MKTRQLLGLIARLLVGGALIYSGASKLLGPTEEFAAALAAYHLLPAGMVSQIANIWPWVELLIGTYLFFGYYTRLCAGAAAGMFALFLTFLVSALLRGLELGSCGCFGAGIQLSVKTTAGLDAALLVLSLLLVRYAKTTPAYSVDSWIEK